MSGIFGILRRDSQPVSLDELNRMEAMLAHRGPDGSAIWHEGELGLGHLMLRTTPEALDEKLPLIGQDGNLLLTADARIDNRAELISQLQLSQGSITDSDIILAAYQKWGETCPEKLIGDFAFAIWDKQQQHLFCARDHMGVRPFYYHLSTRLFAFASEIKALFCLADVPRTVNDWAVAYYVAAIEDDKEITFYQDIVRLPPAHALVIDARGVRRWRYWQLDPGREVRLRSDEEYAEAFYEIFAEAVRCRLRSPFPVGAMLSGGLDSSSLVSTARKLMADNGGSQLLHTYSAIFPSLPEADRRVIDERPYIDAVIAAGGIEAHSVRADLLTPLTYLEHSLWHQDGVFFGPTMYIEEEITRAAQRDGIRVMLDGLDGDTTISHGWQRLPQLVLKGQWLTLIREVNAHKRISGRPFSRKEMILNQGFLPLVPRWLIHTAKQLRRQPAEPIWQSRPINLDFARSIGFADHPHVQAVMAHHDRAYHGARADHIEGVEFSVNVMVVELMNKSKSAFGMEARHPFYDRRLIEFCIALPASQKFKNGWPRWILRRGMEGVLPPKVQWRPDKGDLSMNFRRRLLSDEENVFEALFAQPERIERYINISVVQRAYEKFKSRPMQGDDHLFALYLTVMLDSWLKGLDFNFAAKPQ
jgi:asparagine synthase (glutamine-hydrolysing)